MRLLFNVWCVTTKTCSLAIPLANRRNLFNRDGGHTHVDHVFLEKFATVIIMDVKLVIDDVLKVIKLIRTKIYDELRMFFVPSIGQFQDTIVSELMPPYHLRVHWSGNVDSFSNVLL